MAFELNDEQLRPFILGTLGREKGLSAQNLGWAVVFEKGLSAQKFGLGSGF